MKIIFATSQQVKVENLENQVAKVEKENQMQNQKIEAQDLTIDALKLMTDDRFASVENNLEAINPGNVASMIYVERRQ